MTWGELTPEHHGRRVRATVSHPREHSVVTGELFFITKHHTPHLRENERRVHHFADWVPVKLL